MGGKEMKLGVICDGISRNLRHAVDVMDEFGLQYAELQFVGDKEVGDHTKAEIVEIDALLRARGKPVSCLSRHIFAGTSSANRPDDALHCQHMDALKRVIEMAHIVDAPLVRIMTQKKRTDFVGQERRREMECGPWCVGYHGANDCAGGRIGQSRRRDLGGGDGQRHHGQFQLHRS